MRLSSDPSSGLQAVPADTRLNGEVVYLFAYDIAYEMKREPLRELLSQPVGTFAIGSSKRSPRGLFFYRLQMVRLPPLERIGPHGALRLECAVKLLPLGAISISIRVPFKVDQLEDLVEFHDLRFADGSSVFDEARRLAEEVRRELSPHLVRPAQQLGDEEAYTIFCLNGPPAAVDHRTRGAEKWLLENRRAVGALLTEEPDPEHLSEQEALESTARYLSYYDHDLVVVDWDAALVIDEPRYSEEVLYIIELANLQLAELEAYDRMLDDAVERSYRDLSRRGMRGRSRAEVQRELREIRVDLARLSDELSNITKFFGDWHLARIYQALAARFHLGDWHRAIDEKLKTLDDLYQLLQAEQNNRWMLILEGTIVLLFIVDLVVLIWGMK